MLANHPEALKLSVHCIGPTATDKASALPNAKSYNVPNTDGGVPGSRGGSTSHGVLVEHGLAMTDDGDIHLNVDSDTVMLAKGWDDYVRIQLLDKGIGIIGVTFEDIGGFSTSAGKQQTFKGIPYTAWLAMSPAHRWRDLKVMPQKQSDIQIENEGQSKIYNLPIGYSLLRDVGWQIPEYLHNRGINYVGWKHLKGSKTAVVLKGLSDYHEEFHVENDVPFVVHHRGSLRHSYRSDGMSKQFYDRIDAYLSEEKDHPTRWTWEPSEASASIRAQMFYLAKEAENRTPPPESPRVEEQSVKEALKKLDGWLKAVVDGKGQWGRGQLPVPNVVNITFPDVGVSVKTLRLEGTVFGLIVNLPVAIDKAYYMTVRNLLSSEVVIQTHPSTKVVTIPSGKCFGIVVDVDGVIHVE